ASDQWPPVHHSPAGMWKERRPRTGRRPLPSRVLRCTRPRGLEPSDRRRPVRIPTLYPGKRSGRRPRERPTPREGTLLRMERRPLVAIRSGRRQLRAGQVVRNARFGNDPVPQGPDTLDARLDDLAVDEVAGARGPLHAAGTGTTGSAA